MTQQPAGESADCILVAIDASPHSLAALQAAAELAALLQVELHGIFVEDINLLHVCGLPFSQEVGSFSATVRRLDSQLIERQFRSLAADIRHNMAQVANRVQVRWSFEVARGAVASQILAAADRAALVSLGRIGRSKGKHLGSTARSIVHSSSRPLLILDRAGRMAGPLTVVYTGTDASKWALQLALQLAGLRRETVTLVIAAEGDQAQLSAEAIAALTADMGDAPVNVVVANDRELLAQIRRRQAGTLFAPVTHAHLLAEVTGSAILVP